MRSRIPALVRVLVGAAVIGILGYTFVRGIPARGANLFDYFGFFTNLTSLLTAVVLIAAGTLAFRGRRSPDWITSVRAVAVASMLVVGLVYNLIVPGTGTAPVWVSIGLHVVLPIVLLLDWTLVPDRPALPWSRLCIVLPYPLVWLIVVLVRGATDGWVPYGFLLPDRGALALAGTVLALLCTLLASGAAVWALSRVGTSSVASRADSGQTVAQP